MLFRKSNEMDSRIWSGFHRKTVQERQQVLRLSFPNLFAVDEDAEGDDGATPHGFPMARPLPITVADQMVENCIGQVQFTRSSALDIHPKVFQQQFHQHSGRAGGEFSDQRPARPGPDGHRGAVGDCRMQRRRENHRTARRLRVHNQREKCSRRTYSHGYRAFICRSSLAEGMCCTCMHEVWMGV